MRAHIASVLALFLSVGCATADVSGDYTVNTRNGANACMFDNWTEGDTGMNIPVTVRQDPDDEVQLDVMGGVGTFLDVFAGSSIFNGSVSGNQVTAALIGQNSANMGGCNYTITIDLDASLDGDTLEGTLTYRPVTNGHPDCGILETCANEQTFNGSRPPTE